MKLSNLIEGLQILSKYYRDDGSHIGAEHDELYAYETHRRLEPDDVDRMAELGWIQHDVNWEGPESYDQTASWVAYT